MCDSSFFFVNGGKITYHMSLDKILVEYKCRLETEGSKLKETELEQPKLRCAVETKSCLLLSHDNQKELEKCVFKHRTTVVVEIRQAFIGI